MLKQLAILSALAVGTVAVAHAATISQISIGANDSFTISGNSGDIIFYNPASVGAGATGNFSVFTAANGNVTVFPTFPGTATPPGCTTMCNPTQPLPFTLGYQTVQQNLGVPSVLALTATEGSNILDFYLTSYTTTEGGCAIACLTVDANGYFTETGFATLPGTFTFTAQSADYTGQYEDTISATGVEAPEPASLFLLGTGLIGAVGFARRRFLPTT